MLTFIVTLVLMLRGIVVYHDIYVYAVAITVVHGDRVVAAAAIVLCVGDVDYYVVVGCVGIIMFAVDAYGVIVAHIVGVVWCCWHCCDV